MIKFLLNDLGESEKPYDNEDATQRDAYVRLCKVARWEPSDSPDQIHISVLDIRVRNLLSRIRSYKLLLKK